MFDADTVALMARATALDGLDLGELPQLLTSAYATIVSARIRLRESEVGEEVPADLADIVANMKRLAFSHEAFVSVFNERESRAASAFVAGEAHHLVLLADLRRRQAPTPSSLGFDSISSEVSATLLFLVAEASADASEMAKSITVDTADLVEAALLSAIRSLACGRLRDIIEADVPLPAQFVSTDFGTQAVRALYYMLLKGIRSLAADILGIQSVSFADVSPQKQFGHVKNLCVEPLNEIGVSQGGNSYSLYPGPLHLASLLAAVARDLSSSSLANLPGPTGVDPARWMVVMQEIAARRPFLWRNHRQAIARGYLEPGTSATISFPTGAGKSTLAELKIAAALLRGVKVLFLTPTLSLVDQTARALAQTFRNAGVQQQRGEELLFDFEVEALPAISVMTPERCLAQLSFDRERFADVGLLVFDECHLMHPREVDRSRRAIDSMLCVLNLTAVAPMSDVLFLSAMMKNGDEIAAWISSLTERPCLSLALNWKPTRQVRGCVVYSEVEVSALKSRLKKVRDEVTNKDAPTKLKRELNVQPFGFFCLHQTWQSTARKDYALLPLLNEAITLSTGTAADRTWYLTPNGNQVASAIAEATARQRLKTLVFTQTIPLAISASNRLARELGAAGCELGDDERRLHAVAVDESGGADRVYLEVDRDGRLVSSSACHHGLLLPEERQLHESLFRRPDGVNVLVATSTLAQGVNLPSEVVIIGGDSRFDTSGERMEKLEAHELLNAAGRAGRAGDGSHGLVLVVPSKVVHFNNETSTIHNHWAELKGIFEQSDQCLIIDDPMTALLDQIHDATTSDMSAYLLRRLPVGSAADSSSLDAPATMLLRRSFAAFRARVRGDHAWVDTRVESAMLARRADPEASDVLSWADQLAAAAGVPVSIIRDIGQTLSGQLRHDASVNEWRDWLIDWLRERPHLVPCLVRREGLEGLFGTPYKSLKDDAKRGAYAASRIFLLLDRWMAGDTLADIERAFGTTEHRIGKCEAARAFALRIVPDLAYIFSLPAQVFRSIAVERGDQGEIPLGLNCLGRCVKEGLDSVDKLALRQYRRGRPGRRAIHSEFSRIAPYMASVSSDKSFEAVIARVREAVQAVNRVP
jgi:superfamily II DNA/RNA helicase